MITITLAQLNVTIGDMDGNVCQMVAAAQRARDDGAELVVFSELSLTGYYPGDLLDEPHFMARVDAGFEALLLASRQMPALHWVIGMPAAHQGPGKPLRNVLRVVRAGEVLLEYAKQLLPLTTSSASAATSSPAPTWPRCYAWAVRRWASWSARTAGTTTAPTT